MMFAVFLLYGLGSAAAEVMLVITAVENSTVSLDCTAVRSPGVEYRAVRWYKEGEDPRLTGLVSSSPPGGPLRWYVGADTHISVDYPSLALRLPPVSCSDSGVYQCYMAAPVGQQNREGRVRLSVLGCSSDPFPTPVSVMSMFLMNSGSLYIWLAVGVLSVILVVIAFFFICRKFEKSLWSETKTPGKEPCPDPNAPLEKQELL